MVLFKEHLEIISMGVYRNSVFVISMRVYRNDDKEIEFKIHTLNYLSFICCSLFYLFFPNEYFFSRTNT